MDQSLTHFTSCARLKITKSDHFLKMIADDWIARASRAIDQRGRFCVALSGGSTPIALYQKLASEYQNKLDWSKVWLFWGDERCVASNDPQNNFNNAMAAGFNSLPIPSSQIFPIPSLNENAPELYSKILQDNLNTLTFDLVMLGMGEDGHTLSLFPKTRIWGYHESQFLVERIELGPNSIARISLTKQITKHSRALVGYVCGSGKAEICKNIFKQKNFWHYPASWISFDHPCCTWMLDDAAYQYIK